MSQYVQQCKSWKQTVITQINDCEFMVEGSKDNLRIGFEVDPSSLTYANFVNGPLLHINKDFLGKGLIKDLQIIDCEQQEYAAVKVIMYDK